MVSTLRPDISAPWERRIGVVYTVPSDSTCSITLVLIMSSPLRRGFMKNWYAVEVSVPSSPNDMCTEWLP